MQMLVEKPMAARNQELEFKDGGSGGQVIGAGTDMMLAEEDAFEFDNQREPASINERMEANVSNQVDFVSALGDVTSNREVAASVIPDDKIEEVYFT